MLILLLLAGCFCMQGQIPFIRACTDASLPDSMKGKYPVEISSGTEYLPYLRPDQVVVIPTSFLATSPTKEEIQFFFRRAVPGLPVNPDGAPGLLFHLMTEQSLLRFSGKTRIKNAGSSSKMKDLLSQYLESVPELKIWMNSPAALTHPDDSISLPGEDSLLISACEQLWRAEEYPLAIRIAFYQYHILGNDTTALFLLTEGIRRMIYRQPGTAYKGFGSEAARSVLRTGGIFRDLRLLEPDTTGNKYAHGAFTLAAGAPLLETYGEMMEYLLRQFRRIPVNEMHLTAALWYARHHGKRDSCLQRYLKEKNILHHAFADAMLNNRLQGTIRENSRDLNYLFPLEKYIREESGLKKQDSSLLPFDASTTFLKTFKGPVIFLEDVRRWHPEEYRRIEYFRRICAGPLMEEVSESEHCTGFILNAIETDTSVWRKKNPFYADPLLWEWMEKENLRSVAFTDPYLWENPDRVKNTIWYYIPPLYPFLIPRYALELKDGSPSYAYGVQSIRFDVRDPVPVRVSTETHWKKIRKLPYENLFYYASGELKDGRDRNRGFNGKKNVLYAEPVPAIHNGIYRITYSRSLGKYLHAEAGFGYISKRGSFNESWTDSNEVEFTGHFTYLSEGITWSLALTMHSRSSGVPAPAGLYYSLGTERIQNTFSEIPDSTGAALTYRNLETAFTFTGGGKIMLHHSLLIDIGVKTGFSFGNIKPLASASAYRVPLKKYPDSYLWDPSNDFHYFASTDDVGGTGNNSFATMRLFHSHWIFYPVIRAGFLF
ncbi:MAG: hypothetical protein IT233_03185 [Bacteroidia bacterium]|nr:hypothetical protein [Bacteroidia bacterium]